MVDEEKEILPLRDNNKGSPIFTTILTGGVRIRALRCYVIKDQNELQTLIYGDSKIETRLHT